MSFSLRSSSDRDIPSRLQELVRRERSLTLSVLLHLNEIERRALHLRQGYPSMFAYCTGCLGYSESAANLRIRAARCIVRFPEVHGLLEANEVNVSTVAQVSKVLTEENKADVLFRMKRKSQREVEAIVAEYDPAPCCPGIGCGRWSCEFRRGFSRPQRFRPRRMRRQPRLRPRRPAKAWVKTTSVTEVIARILPPCARRNINAVTVVFRAHRASSPPLRRGSMGLFLSRHVRCFNSPPPMPS